MRREGGGGGGAGAGEESTVGQGDGDEGDGGLLDQMIQILVQGADMPPREVEGVSEEFCDGM